jgi:hypothetical protein
MDENLAPGADPSSWFIYRTETSERRRNLRSPLRPSRPACRSLDAQTVDE